MSFSGIPVAVTCPIAAGTECRVRDVAAVDDVTVEDMLGTWYSKYLLRGASAWTAATYHYERDARGQLHGFYTGTT